MPDRRRPSAPHIAAIGGVLAVAAALRLIGLSSQGISNYDEGAHLLEARFLRHALSQSPQDLSEVAGLPLFHGKPLHAALLALSQVVTGDRVWAGGLVSALFGIATTGLVYHAARSLRDHRAGLAAALLYGLFPWSVLYGRVALAEADSAFLVAATALALARAGDRRTPAAEFLRAPPPGGGTGPHAGGEAGSSGGGEAGPSGGREAGPSGGREAGQFRGGDLGRTAVAGLLGGLAFLANYRWGVLIGLLVMFAEAWRVFVSGARQNLVPALPPAPAPPPPVGARLVASLIRVLVFSAVGAALVLAVDALYSHLVLGPLLSASSRPRTYLEDLAYNFGRFGSMGIGLRDPLRLPLFLWVYGTSVIVLALAAAFVGRRVAGARPAYPSGLATAGSPWPEAGVLLALLGLIPIVLFLVTPCVFPRCLSAAFVSWCVFAGVGWVRLGARLSSTGGRGPGRGPVELAGLGLLLGLQLLLTRNVWGPASGYGDAARWLDQRRAVGCLSTQSYVMRAYGLDRTLGWPATPEELPALVKRGYRYGLVDNQIWISGASATVRWVRSHLEPVARLAHPAGGSPAFVWEAPEKTVRETWARTAGEDWLKPSVIEIYDLGDGRPSVAPGP